MSASKPDPDSASRDEVAEYCGIKRYRAPELVPLAAYQQAGVLRCRDAGVEPDPPSILLANYPIVNGDRRLLSNHAFADYVADHSGLARAQAAVVAYLVAGYSHEDTADALGRSVGTISIYARNIRNQLAEAEATTAILRTFN